MGKINIHRWSGARDARHILSGQSENILKAHAGAAQFKGRRVKTEQAPSNRFCGDRRRILSGG